MEDFTQNPCRHHLFEVFALDKSETDLRALRTAVQAARDRLRFGRLLARDGSQLQLKEADLNALEKQLLNPVECLKAEQLVHQAHPFARDGALALCLDRLAAEDKDPLPGLRAEARAQA